MFAIDKLFCLRCFYQYAGKILWAVLTMYLLDGYLFSRKELHNNFMIISLCQSQTSIENICAFKRRINKIKQHIWQTLVNMALESFFNIVTPAFLQAAQDPRLIMDGAACCDVDRWYLPKLWFVGILEEVSVYSTRDSRSLCCSLCRSLFNEMSVKLMYLVFIN